MRKCSRERKLFLNMNNLVEDEKTRAINKDKGFGVGVAILRCYMALIVVLTHLSERMLTPVGGLLRLFDGFHVPVFMLLSFLMCAKYFLEPTKELIIKRVLRIVIPFFFWGIMGFISMLIIWNVKIDTLLWQLLVGLPANSSLWFLAVTLWIAVIFWLIRLVSNKKVFIIVISVIGVLAIASQYTGLNFLLFDKLPNSPRFAIGRILEMMPYAAMGILVSFLLPIIKRFGLKEHLIIFISAGIILAGLLMFDRFIYKDRPQGFGYSGIFMLVGAFFLVTSAFTNPLNFITNHTFKSVIKWITSFTLGVFCMHLVLGPFLEMVFIALSLEIKTGIIGVVTYLVCYLISFLIYLIPCKYTKQLVS